MDGSFYCTANRPFGKLHRSPKERAASVVTRLVLAGVCGGNYSKNNDTLHVRLSTLFGSLFLRFMQIRPALAAHIFTSRHPWTPTLLQSHAMVDGTRNI